jgi:hypothetical protein
MKIGNPRVKRCPFHIHGCPFSVFMDRIRSLGGHTGKCVFKPKKAPLPAAVVLPLAANRKKRKREHEEDEEQNIPVMQRARQHPDYADNYDDGVVAYESDDVEDEGDDEEESAGSQSDEHSEANFDEYDYGFEDIAPPGPLDNVNPAAPEEYLQLGGGLLFNPIDKYVLEMEGRNDNAVLSDVNPKDPRLYLDAADAFLPEVSYLLPRMGDVVRDIVPGQIAELIGQRLLRNEERGYSIEDYAKAEHTSIRSWDDVNLVSYRLIQFQKKLRFRMKTGECMKLGWIRNQLYSSDDPNSKQTVSNDRSTMLLLFELHAKLRLSRNDGDILLNSISELLDLQASQMNVTPEGMSLLQ